MRLLSTFFVLAILLVSIAACNSDGEEPTTAPTYPDGKPTGVTAEAGDRSATINWYPVNGAAGYNVYISYDGVGFNRYGGGMITSTSFSVFNLTNGQTYYFAVSAVGEGGWESSLAYPGGSPTASPVIPGPKDPDKPDYLDIPPYAPLNLQGIAKDSTVELEWDNYPPELQVPDFDYYRIYRRHNTGSFSSTWQVREDSWNGFYYLDRDLENSETYSYRLTAFDNEDLESDPSNVVTLTPMDLAPEQLKNVELFVNAGRIVLEWDVPLEPDIEFYAVERVEGIDPGSGAEIIVRFLIDKPTQTAENPEEYGGGLVKVWVDLNTNRVVALDGAVVIGVEYTYRLSALDTSGQEGAPLEITADVPVY